MVYPAFWLNPLSKIGKSVLSAPTACLNLGLGIICGAAQAVGIELFTRDTLNDAISLKTAADACQDELPIKLTTERDEITSIMTAGSKGAVAKAKAVLKSADVDDKCIAIFGLVCSKAEQLGAAEIIKEACANLWV